MLLQILEYVVRQQVYILYTNNVMCNVKKSRLVLQFMGIFFYYRAVLQNKPMTNNMILKA